MREGALKIEPIVSQLQKFDSRIATHGLLVKMWKPWGRKVKLSYAYIVCQWLPHGINFGIVCGFY